MSLQKELAVASETIDNYGILQKYESLFKCLYNLLIRDNRAIIHKFGEEGYMRQCIQE